MNKRVMLVMAAFVGFVMVALAIASALNKPEKPEPAVGTPVKETGSAPNNVFTPEDETGVLKLLSSWATAVGPLVVDAEMVSNADSDDSRQSPAQIACGLLDDVAQAQLVRDSGGQSADCVAAVRDQPASLRALAHVTPGTFTSKKDRRGIFPASLLKALPLGSPKWLEEQAAAGVNAATVSKDKYLVMIKGALAPVEISRTRYGNWRISNTRELELTTETVPSLAAASTLYKCLRGSAKSLVTSPNSITAASLDDKDLSFLPPAAADASDEGEVEISDSWTGAQVFPTTPFGYDQPLSIVGFRYYQAGTTAGAGQSIAVFLWPTEFQARTYAKAVKTGNSHLEEDDDDRMRLTSSADGNLTVLAERDAPDATQREILGDCGKKATQAMDVKPVLEKSVPSP